LWMKADQPIMRGCSTPFLNLNSLTVNEIPPPGPGSLLLAPNLEFLKLSYGVDWEVPRPTHGLEYMLSPGGILGPIRALKGLYLSRIPLSNGAQANYCTYYLGFHPTIESLHLSGYELPKDFLELMLQPADGTSDLLPNLKRLDLYNCGREGPPEDWFVELTRLRPSLVINCSRRFGTVWPKS
ncbi:1397_t:CDS:1, partial [Acaulospora colombiana]